MITAWTIIGFFMLRFLLKDLINPYKEEEEETKSKA
jgi:hypothetical protein